MDAPSLFAAIVTALLALVGAIVGSWLSRRSEYEKWYRQEKASALAEYLTQLHDTRNKARDAYYSEEGTHQIGSMRVTEAFTELSKFTSIARLFLPEPDRENLTELQNKLWIYCSSQGGPADNITEIKSIMQSIQVLIEREFTKVPRA